MQKILKHQHLHCEEEMVKPSPSHTAWQRKNNPQALFEYLSGIRCPKSLGRPHSNAVYNKNGQVHCVSTWSIPPINCTQLPAGGMRFLWTGGESPKTSRPGPSWIDLGRNMGREVLPHLDCAHVHGVLDDVTVVMQAQRLHIHGLVERPGIGSVLFGKHLFEDATAALKLL